jgi:hypothetical protein
MQASPNAWIEFLVAFFFNYLPVISVGIIVVTVAAIVYNSMDQEKNSERRAHAQKLKNSMYPDFEMDLNRSEHLGKQTKES